jgi:hypothetical protein
MLRSSVGEDLPTSARRIEAVPVVMIIMAHVLGVWIEGQVVDAVAQFSRQT